MKGLLAPFMLAAVAVAELGPGVTITTAPPSIVMTIPIHLNIP